jgi:hypothetical protein
MRPDKVRIMTGGKYITRDPYREGDSQLISGGRREDQVVIRKKKRGTIYEGAYSEGSAQERSKQERKKGDGAGLTSVSYLQRPRSRNSERNNPMWRQL